jgi:quinol monooxygenase YgiN
MFIVTVRFTVRPGYEERFLEAARAQRVNSLTREPACDRFDVCVSADRPRDVFLYEAYASAAAFDAHLLTAHFENFGSVTREWIEQKAVDTWTLSATRG